MGPSGGTPVYSAAKLTQALHTRYRRSNGHVFHLGGNGLVLQLGGADQPFGRHVTGGGCAECFSYSRSATTRCKRTTAVWISRKDV